MNKCTFFGLIIHKDFFIDDLGKEKIVIVLEICNKRSANSKHIDTERLVFEAWGSAAISLNELTDIHSELLIIDSTARHVNVNYNFEVRFRINEFKII